MPSPPPAVSGQIPTPARVLGWLGLVPFVSGALSAWVAPIDFAGLTVGLTLFYAAAVLAFLGAVHWGFALADARAGGGRLWRQLGLGVLPALLAWLVTGLTFEPVQMTLLLVLGHLAVLLGDRVAVRHGWAPAWYLRLRVPLALVAIVCLLAIAARFQFPPPA